MITGLDPQAIKSNININKNINGTVKIDNKYLLLKNGVSSLKKFGIKNKMAIGEITVRNVTK